MGRTVHDDPPGPPYSSAVPSPDWQLFLDWCAAAGHDALPTTAATVITFLNEIPAGPSTTRRRGRAIRDAHTAAGHLSPIDHHGTTHSPHPPATAAVRAGDGWLTPEQALTHLPVDLWPHGLHARRDGVLLLLLGPLGQTKQQALAATARSYPLPGIGATDLTTDPDSRVCHACVLTRWLTALTATAHGGRFAAEEVIVGARRGGQTGVHDCLENIEDGWQQYPLLPSIDQHGWISDTALTPRSLAAIISRRQDPTHVPSTAPNPAKTTARATAHQASQPWQRTRDTPILDELDELLTRLETTSTQLMTRLGDALG